MLLSVPGLSQSLAAFSNLVLAATAFKLPIAKTTELVTSNMYIRIAILYAYLYSILRTHTPCLLAIVMYSVIEIDSLTEQVANDVENAKKLVTA
jgi:hypothetical protein